MRLNSVLNMGSSQAGNSGGMLSQLLSGMNGTSSASAGSGSNSILDAVNGAMGTNFASMDEAKSASEFIKLYGIDPLENKKMETEKELTEQQLAQQKDMQKNIELFKLASTFAELAKNFKEPSKMIHEGKGGTKVYARK